MVRCVATEKHKDAAARRGGVEVEFADEEDYVKGGGGELLYVQMQASKSMDSQSKISSKVGGVAVNKSYHYSNFFCLFMHA